MGPILHAATLVSAAAVSALFSAIWEAASWRLALLFACGCCPASAPRPGRSIWLTVSASASPPAHRAPHFSGRVRSGGPAHAIHLDLGWSIAIVAVWAGLSLWRGTQLILSAIRLTRLANRATPFAHDPALLSMIEGSRAARSALPSRSSGQACSAFLARAFSFLPH